MSLPLYLYLSGEPLVEPYMHSQIQKCTVYSPSKTKKRLSPYNNRPQSNVYPSTIHLLLGASNHPQARSTYSTRFIANNEVPRINVSVGGAQGEGKKRQKGLEMRNGSISREKRGLWCVVGQSLSSSPETGSLCDRSPVRLLGK